MFRYENDGPVCKIIRKSLIDYHNILFEETTNQNDVRFSYTTGHLARSIKVDYRAIYTVTYSPKSLMFTWNHEKIKTRIGVCCRKVLFLKRNNIVTGSLHCIEKLLPNIKKNAPNLFEECLHIISEHGLDPDYYRNYTILFFLKEEKEKKKTKRRNEIKRVLNPLKEFIYYRLL